MFATEEVEMWDGYQIRLDGVRVGRGRWRTVLFLLARQNKLWAYLARIQERTGSMVNKDSAQVLKVVPGN